MPHPRLLPFALASLAAHGMLFAVGSRSVPVARHVVLGEQTVSLELLTSRARANAKNGEPPRSLPKVRAGRPHPVAVPRSTENQVVAARDPQERSGNAPPSSSQRADANAARSALLGEVQTRLSHYLTYPPLARRQGWEGEVLLGFDIEPDGRLVAIHIAHSSGYDILDRSALNSLKKVAQIENIRLASRILTGMRLPVTYRLTEN